ncbi:MAG: hypothetical protein EBR33_05355 [Synechococcaceae bacterium WB4_1_0192]|nr:hypothetical protein [Synechococcaceae bacterium WB4_1_0192]
MIGAGVSGCSLAAALRRLGWGGSLTLLEIGRGPGGRSATRRSRRDPALAINHGAPLFNITASPEPQLLEPLRRGGWLQPFAGASHSLDANGQLGPLGADPFCSGQLWQGQPQMDDLCRGLLSLAAASGGWDDIPLQRAAALLEDPQLNRAAAALAAIDSSPGCQLLLTLPEATAQRWRLQPWRLLTFTGAAQQRWGLRRVSQQPQRDGRWAVVAESSADFASRHRQVYGSRSSAAQLLGAPADLEAEQQVMAALERALQAALGLTTTGAERQLMRWGAAFPHPPGLDPALALCQASRIGFCGDTIAGPGFGRVEGALRSAEALATRLLPQL